MVFARIKSLNVEFDVVPQIVLRLDLPADALGLARHHVLLRDFQGVLAFYRAEVHGSTIGGAPSTGRRTLAASWRWDNRATFIHPDVTRFVELVVPLDATALEALEDFREGGSLWLRPEGRFQFLAHRDGGAQAELVQMLMLQSHGDAISFAELLAESHEMHADKWGRDVLSQLRRTSTFTLSFDVEPARAEQAAEAVRNLADARSAFDQGLYAEAVRSAYVALEAVEKQSATVEARLGTYARARTLGKNGMSTALTALCNPKRHAEEPGSADLRVDRQLAQFVIASASALVGYALR